MDILFTANGLFSAFSQIEIHFSTKAKFKVDNSLFWFREFSLFATKNSGVIMHSAKQIKWWFYVMGGFRIYQDNYADFTIVSNQFIDEYMEDANDAQLKVYLYLIRMLGADLMTSVSDIADRFNYTEKDVIRALHYWEKKQLISLEYGADNKLCGVCMLPTTMAKKQSPARSFSEQPVALSQVQPPVSATIPTISFSTAIPMPASSSPSVKSTRSDSRSRMSSDALDTYEKPTYSKDDLKAFKSREESSQLVFIAEQYLQKTLSVAELSSLLYISDSLHFSNDLIDYLLQYCVGREKTDHRYIEAVALDWARCGITTPKQAASHARKYDKIVYEVMNALGKSSAPSNIEIEFINKWTKNYAYDMSVISIACERTVLNTDRKRFNYADSILTHWHELGIRNKADIELLDPPKKKVFSSPARADKTDRNSFNQYSQNTYDFEILEKECISN